MSSILLIISLLFYQPKFPNYDFAKQVADKYDTPRKDFVILIDYSKSINEERLCVYDMTKREIILTSKVSHAYNSGKGIPTDFSNQINSKKSSKGAFMTLGSYNGSWGYSMRLRGLDKDINDNAEKRYLIFHPYVTTEVNYSDGCFMTQKKVNKTIIDLTKNGCLVYVY